MNFSILSGSLWMQDWPEKMDCRWNETEEKVVAALINKLIILNAKYIQYMYSKLNWKTCIPTNYYWWFQILYIFFLMQKRTRWIEKLLWMRLKKLIIFSHLPPIVCKNRDANEVDGGAAGVLCILYTPPAVRGCVCCSRPLILSRYRIPGTLA